MLGTHVEPPVIIINECLLMESVKLIEADNTNSNRIAHCERSKAYSLDMQHLTGAILFIHR